MKELRTIRTYSIHDIEYDTDGQEDEELPEVILTQIPDDLWDDEEGLEEILSNKISEITGYCHFGFNYSVIDY